MTVAVRFAPSPTGFLHVGNIRLALINWIFARQAGGDFLLRLDDTDTERSEQHYAEAVERDLGWLGLTWDRFARQSDRIDRYQAVMDQLQAMGRLYPCFETAEELGLKRKVLRNAGKPPIYDRAALRLTDQEKSDLIAQGRRPHWRFLLQPGAIEWSDLVRGPVRFDAADLTDPVLIREDGRFLYTLSSVVDDADFAISHVIRGEDHVANTAVQIQLWQALGAPVPDFAHLALLTDAGGQGLSKRLGSLGIGALRDEEGLEPMAILSFLARLGTSDPIEPKPKLEDLVESFAFAKQSRAPAKFDIEELRRLNAKLLHLLPFDRVRDRLANLGLSEVDDAFWHAVRPNLERLRDTAHWWRMAREPVAPALVDPSLTETAAELLPPEPWSTETWAAWTKAVRAASGLSGKALFRPLRLALTGLEHGPEMKNLLPLIGRTRAHARLLGETA